MNYGSQNQRKVQLFERKDGVLNCQKCGVPICNRILIGICRNLVYKLQQFDKLLPSSYVTGSPWVILSRTFIEYCIMGWDNLPRTLLMYFTNVLFSQEGYFHSVACNSPEFKNTTVNSDLRYVEWDEPPGPEPHFLNTTNFDRMIDSGVPFARQFHKDDRVLDMIDEKVLRRRYHNVAPGAWCSTKSRWWIDPCSQCGNVNIVKPGPRSESFNVLMRRLVSEWKSQSRSCK